MKSRLFCLLGAFAAATVLAGPEHLIKQRAKDLRDQNNAAQGVQPRPATAPPTAQQRPAMVPAARAVATPSQQSLTRFSSDLAAITQGASLDASAKSKIAANLMGAAQGTKPGQAAVDRFVSSVHKALAAKPLPAGPRAKLVQDLDAVLNPGKYPQAKMDAIFEDIRSIFVSNGTPSLEAGEIAATARVMAADVRKQ